MNTPSFSRTLLLGLALTAAGCSQYSSVSEKQPRFRAVSPAGKLIARAMKISDKQPEAKIGGFIDAAELAGEGLKKNPKNLQASKDYNFAIGRIWEVIHFAHLQPWKAPVSCPGAHGEWKFTVLTDGKPEHDPSHFRILPADRYQFRGTLVKERAMKDGLGAPMVMASMGFDPTKFDPFIRARTSITG